MRAFRIRNGVHGSGISLGTKGELFADVPGVEKSGWRREGSCGGACMDSVLYITQRKNVGAHETQGIHTWRQSRFQA